MNATAKVIPAGACAGVVLAASKTPVQAALDVAIMGDKLAEATDCLRLAHELSGTHRAVDDQTMRVSSELLDFTLVQPARSLFDVLLLCLLAFDRSGIPYDCVDDKDAERTFDAVQTSLLSMGSFIAAQVDPQLLRSIPERYRSEAEDMLGNAIGVDAARAVFA